MEHFDRKNHWETIYQTKELKDVSWFQQKPSTSIELIEESAISKTAKIIDIGGGDSFLADYLLENGYTDITVLDISEKAIERAKHRLGEKANKIKWIVADVANFHLTEKYDLWHDRAAFHFLTKDAEIENYLTSVTSGLATEGVIIIGTFSEEGPEKCSTLEIKQYNEEMLTNTFLGFTKQKCFVIDHITPFNTKQNFTFCLFKNI